MAGYAEVVAAIADRGAVVTGAIGAAAGGDEFALCGSSARKLKRGHANLLGGRAIRYELFGFSARELGVSLCCYNSYRERFAEFSFWRLSTGVEVDFVVNDLIPIRPNAD